MSIQEFQKKLEIASGDALFTALRKLMVVGDLDGRGSPQGRGVDGAGEGGPLLAGWPQWHGRQGGPLLAGWPQWHGRQDAGLPQTA